MCKRFFVNFISIYHISMFLQINTPNIIPVSLLLDEIKTFLFNPVINAVENRLLNIHTDTNPRGIRTRGNYFTKIKEISGEIEKNVY